MRLYDLTDALKLCKAIEKTDGYSEGEMNMFRCLYAEMISAPYIDIEPKQGEWIPVSERLPDKDKTVLCTHWHEKYGTTVVKDSWTGVTNHGIPQFELHPNIIAWMPLPEPWKGADDE